MSLSDADADGGVVAMDGDVGDTSPARRSSPDRNPASEKSFDTLEVLIPRS